MLSFRLRVHPASRGKRIGNGLRSDLSSQRRGRRGLADHPRFGEEQRTTSRQYRRFTNRSTRAIGPLYAVQLTSAQRSSHQAGLTLVELIVTVAILAILASAAVPLARFQAKREKERQLRYDLWQMRDAIDAYKDAADRHAFMTKADSGNYPPDLDTLVKGVDAQGKKLKFLRRIPVDPMTGKAEWTLRSMQDDPIATRGEGRMSLTSPPSRKALRSMERSTPIGRLVSISGFRSRTICALCPATPRGRLHPGGVDGGDADHRHPGGHRDPCVCRIDSRRPGSGPQRGPARHARCHRCLYE